MSSSLSTWNQCRVCYLLLRRGFDVPKIVYITVWTFKLNSSHQEEGSADSEPETEWGDAHCAFEAHPGAPSTSVFIILVWNVYLILGKSFIFVCLIFLICTQKWYAVSIYMSMAITAMGSQQLCLSALGLRMAGTSSNQSRKQEGSRGVFLLGDVLAAEGCCGGNHCLQMMDGSHLWLHR